MLKMKDINARFRTNQPRLFRRSAGSWQMARVGPNQIANPWVLAQLGTTMRSLFAIFHGIVCAAICCVSLMPRGWAQQSEKAAPQADSPQEHFQSAQTFQIAEIGRAS